MMVYDYWFTQYNYPDEKGDPYLISGGITVWNNILKRQIPVTWSDGIISDYGPIVSGGTPSTIHSEYYTDNGNAWITPNDLSGQESYMFISHGERDITSAGINNSSAVPIPKGTVLLSTRAPIGYLAIADNELCTNQGFKSIIPNRGYSNFYIYYFLKRNMSAIAQLGVGTTFKEVSKDTLASFPAPIIPIDIIERFNDRITQLCELRHKNEIENMKLINLRDWLLPMLMNGQATIED